MTPAELAIAFLKSVNVPAVIDAFGDLVAALREGKDPSYAERRIEVEIARAKLGLPRERG